MDKIKAERTALHDEIKNLKDSKFKLREDFYTKLLAFEKQ